MRRNERLALAVIVTTGFGSMILTACGLDWLYAGWMLGLIVGLAASMMIVAGRDEQEGAVK